MTTISAYNSSVALLILQQANSASPIDGEKKTAADKIIETVNQVSSETSAVKTQASATINSGLLDIKAANDSIVSSALDFLDSDSVKSSDPNAKNTLKNLISENGDAFASLVKAEQAKNPRISQDNAMANAMQGLIRSNRDKFADDEFVIGFKLTGGGAILSNIEDMEGNSTSNTLRNNVISTASTLTDATKSHMAASAMGDNDAMKAADAVLKSNDIGSAVLASGKWMSGWMDKFGWS